MGKPVFLLGAGASIDAGLFDTNRLTREIYKILRADHYKVPGKVFGYVIAKILARKIRQGGSPYDEVNVEEAYDGVERLVYRDRDIASEFVSSWDPFLEALRPAFDKDKFVRNLERAIHIDDRSYSRGASLTFEHFRMMDLAEEIEKATSSSAFSEQANILPYLMGALLKCLEHDPEKTEYAKQLVDIIVDGDGIIGSLNYDMIIESSLTERGLTHDYGLSSWNAKRIVSFTGSRADVRLMKLHGSMNWHGTDDTIIIDAELRDRAPMLLFGGGGGKLRPDGPYLQLRHEFERQLLATNAFVVVGYSFGDGHLNAMIRRWVSTRRKAKMIIVDPAPLQFATRELGTPYTVSKEGKLQAKTVDITHIKKRTALSIKDLSDELKRPITLTIPAKLSGTLPNVLVKVVE